MAQNGAQLLAHFRAKGLPIVHVRHEFTTEDAPFFQPISDCAAIHSSVAPLENEPVILKHHVNSFRETKLEAILRENGVERLVIVGAMSHMFIDTIARATTDFGYEYYVAHDACTTLDLKFTGKTVPAHHVHALCGCVRSPLWY